MTTLAQSDPPPESVSPHPAPGKRYRFVVSSAEEAVATIRRRFGGNARVLSVKQVDGKGLSKFLHSPRLEVIAWVPPQGQSAFPELPERATPHFPRETDQPDSANAPPTRESAASDEPAWPDEGPVTAGETGTRDYGKELASTARARRIASESPEGDTTPTEREVSKPATRVRAGDSSADLRTVLLRARFDSNLLMRFENDPAWADWCALPLQHALAGIAQVLRRDYESMPRQAVTGRIAFLGTPGVGKTTALCKCLARDVFIAGKKPRVLKLDNDTPNSDDTLRALCEVFGVEMVRELGSSGEGLEPGALYVDSAGMAVADEEELALVRDQLDTLRVDTRAVVINAAYDSGAVDDSFEMAHRLGATHLVLTHLDEAGNATRLWPRVLRGGLTPLFCGEGQNVTDGLREDVADCLLERTFPRYLLT